MKLYETMSHCGGLKKSLETQHWIDPYLEKIAELRKELFKLSYKILDLEENLEKFKNEVLKNIDKNVKENFELKKDILK